MSHDSHRELIERVRLILRARKALPVLSDREAALHLRPYGQGVIGAPVNVPVNHSRPSAGDPGGARDELEFGSVVGDSS